MKSKFERRFAKNLASRGITYDYERETFDVRVPVRDRVQCDGCGGKDIVHLSKYTPDFFIGDLFIVETKGKFTAENRGLLLAFKEQYPDKDLRLVFMRNNKLHPRSPTRYLDWAAAKGFPAHVGDDIPDEWLPKPKPRRRKRK